MQIHISSSTEKTIVQLANWLVDYIQQTLAVQDRFTIALSGGSTPKALYQLLATDEYSNKINWQKIHFFWGDERYLPFTDERNNAHMAFEALLTKVPVQKEHIHIINTSISPEESASNYQKLLHVYFDGQETSFDLVLLGLGDNGHTLSLFPSEPILNDNESWARSLFLKEQDMFRITLMHTVVNRAKSVAFLVTGSNKAFMANEIINGKQQPMLLPAQLIKPFNSNVHWFLDEEAAIDLGQPPSD